MIIQRDGIRQITLNFTEKELYSKSKDAPYSHFLDNNVVAALQVIRQFYGRKIRVTSSYRTEKGNKDVGGVKSSRHLTGHALDFVFEGGNKEFNKEIKSKGPLFEALLSLGVDGFGMYDSFNHIDVNSVNTVGSNANHAGIPYRVWDNTTGGVIAGNSGNEEFPMKRLVLTGIGVMILVGIALND